MNQEVDESVGEAFEQNFFKYLSKLQQEKLLKHLVPLIKYEVEKQLNNKQRSHNTIWQSVIRRFFRIITDFLIFLCILFMVYFFFYITNEISHKNGDPFYQTIGIK